MTRIHVRVLPTLDVEHPVDRGHEPVDLDALPEELVHLREYGPDGVVVPNLGDERGAEGRHDERGRNPLSRDVRDHDPQVPFRDPHVVVVIPAHQAR